MFLKVKKLSWVVENHKINYFLNDLFLNKDHILSITESEYDSQPEIQSAFNNSQFSDISISTSTKKETITVLGSPESILRQTKRERTLLHD